MAITGGLSKALDYTNYIKEQNKKAQTEYNQAVTSYSSGSGGAGLSGNALAMYGNISSAERQQAEQAKAERAQMGWLERTGHTLGDFFGNVAIGTSKSLEGMGDYFAGLFGASDEYIARDYTDELLGRHVREGTKGSYMYDNKAGEIARNVASGVGGMLPAIAVSAIPLPGMRIVGGAMFGIGAAGQGVERAVQEGASRGKAMLYGTASGALESGIEAISGGLGGIATKVGKGVAKSAIKSGGKTFVKNMIGEGVEEVASDLADPLLSGIYKGKVDYSDVNAKSLAETFTVGALTGGVMQSGQAVARKASPVMDFNARLGELSEIKQNLDKRFNDGKLTQEQYKQGIEDINYLSNDAMKKLQSLRQSKADKVATKLGDNNLAEFGIQYDAENSTATRAESVANAESLSYSPSLIGREKELAFKPTTTAVTEAQREALTLTGKLNNNSKLKVVIADMPNIKNADGSEVTRNGAYHDGVLYINKDSTSPLAEVVKHEFTHSLENTKSYGKLANYIFKSIASDPELAKRYGDIDSRYQDTAELYAGDVNLATADADTKAKLNGIVSSEMVAQYISEELFTNPRQIDRIVRASKGFGGKMLNYIQSGIERLKKGKLSAEEKSVQTFLTKAESLYIKAMQKSKPQQKQITAQADGEERDNAQKNVENESNQTADIDKPRYLLQRTTDNRMVVVIEDNILKDIPKSKWIDTVKSAMQRFNKGIPIAGRLIKVNAKSRNEYTQSRNSQNYRANNKVTYVDKLTAANNLDEVILASTNYVNENLRHVRKDSIKEFARGEVLLKIADRQYLAEVIVGFTSTKELLLYDLINFHATTFSLRNKKIDGTKDSEVFDNVTPINNSIPNTTDKINQIDEKSLEKEQKAIKDSKTNSEKAQHNGKEAQNATKGTPTTTKTDGIKHSLYRVDTPGKVSKIPQKAFRASVKDILKDIYVSEELNTAVLSVKQLDKYTKYITENINSGKYTDGDVCQKLAEAVVANAKMVDGEKKTFYLDQAKALRQYKGKLNLDSIYSEIAYNVGSENVAKIVREWGKGDLAPYEIVSKLQEADITIESENSADIFLEMYNKYTKATEELNKAREERRKAQLLTSHLEDKARHTLEQDITKKLMLAVDEHRKQYGTETDDHKLALKKLKQQYRAEVNDLKRQNIAKNMLFTQIDIITNMVNKPSASNPMSKDYINMANAIKKMKTYRNNISKKARQAIESFTDIFCEVRKEAGQWIDDCDVEFAEILNTMKKEQGEFTTAEIASLNIVLDRFIFLARNADTAFYNGKRMHVKDLAAQSIQEQELVAKRSMGLFPRNANKVLDSITDPVAMLERWAGYDKNAVLYNVYKNLDEGVNRQLAFQHKAFEHFEETLKTLAKKKTKWRDSTIKVGGEKGGNISLGQTMSLIMLSERKQSAKHLDNMEDGNFIIKVVNDKYTAKNKYKLATQMAYDVVLNRSEIAKLKEQLTAEQKEYLEKAKVFFNEIAKNAKYEVDMDCYGVSNVLENDQYFPTFVSKDGIEVDMYGENVKDLKTIKSFRFNKAANEHASNKLMLENILDVVDRHTEQMAMYYGLNKPLELFNKVYNRQLDGESLKGKLSQIDANAEDYIKELLEDVQGIGKRADYDFVTKTSDKLFGYGVTAALGMNAKVLLTQFVSLPAALSAGLKVKNLAIGIAKASKMLMTKQGRAVIRKLYQYSPIAWDRVKRGASTEIATAKSKGGKFGKFVTAGIGKVDSWVVETLWVSSLAQVAPNVTEYAEANYEAAAKLLNKIVTQTQQNSHPLYNSKLKRSKSTFVKMSIMFMSDSLKQISMLRKSWSEYIYYKKVSKGLSGEALAEMKKKISKAKRQIWRVSTVISTQIIMLTLIAQAIKWATGKEEEDPLKDMGIDALGNALGMLPIIRDFGTLIDGFEPSNFYESGITNLYNSVSDTLSLIETLASDEPVDETQMKKTLRNSILSLSQTFGIPLRNLEKYGMGAVGWLGDSGKAVQYDYYAQFRNKTVSMYKSELERAVDNNNDKLADSIIKSMMSEERINVDNKVYREYIAQALLSDIDVAPRTIQKTISYNGEKHELTKAQYAQFKSDYEPSVKEVEKMINYKAFQSLEQEQQAKAVRWIYDFYYDMARSKIVGGREQAFAKYDEVLRFVPIQELAIILAQVRNIKASKDRQGRTIPGSRKGQIQRMLSRTNLSRKARAELMAVVV